jgi:hypothetical protein
MLDIPASNLYGTGLLKTNPGPVQYRNEASQYGILWSGTGIRLSMYAGMTTPALVFLMPMPS